MTQSISTEQLWDEALRLNAEIEELQLRLEQLLEMEAVEAEEAACWNAWPYSWAAAGWNLARERFHWLHQKHSQRASLHENQLDAGFPLRLV